jgi:hypothetical protein
LFDVRITVEPHDCRARHVGKRLAHAVSPCAIDEAEVRERVSSQSIDELGWRLGQNYGIRPERTLRRQGRSDKAAQGAEDQAHQDAFLPNVHAHSALTSEV